MLVAEAEWDNLGDKALDERWARWQTCSLCEQEYYDVVACALGWACWKTYVVVKGRCGHTGVGTPGGTPEHWGYTKNTWVYTPRSLNIVLGL